MRQPAAATPAVQSARSAHLIGALVHNNLHTQGDHVRTKGQHRPAETHSCAVIVARPPRARARRAWYLAGAGAERPARRLRVAKLTSEERRGIAKKGGGSEVEVMTDGPGQDEVGAPMGSGSSAAGEIPAFYFNGFTVSLTNADVHAALFLDGKPLTFLHMSYTTAKTLHIKLGEAIERLESATGQKIMIIEQVEGALRKMVGEGQVGS